MEYPDEIAYLHGSIIRAARNYVTQRGWGVVVGRPPRCHDCHALIDSEDHADHCDYNRLRHAVHALDAATPTPGACGDPDCHVLHEDPANPIHPPVT